MANGFPYHTPIQFHPSPIYNKHALISDHTFILQLIYTILLAYSIIIDHKFTMIMISTTLKHAPAVASPITSIPHRSCLPSQRSKIISSSPTTKAQLSDQRSRRYGNGIHSRKLNFSWMATVGENVKAATPVIPTSVPVRVAHELHQAGHRYLDVRTPEEFAAGHAVGAINVPYLFKLGSGMTKNLNFLEEVLSHFGKDDEIIVGCQLGKRSLMAATDLVCAGFTGVTDIAGGYAAWNQNGLPIE